MNKRLYFFALLLCCSTTAALAQTGQSFNYVKGAGATRLDIGIHVFHPCDGNDNGYITITVNNANGGAAHLIFLGGPGGNIDNVPIAQGTTLTFNIPKTLPDGEYDLIIRDQPSLITINTFAEPAYPSFLLQDLLPISIVDNALDLANDNCDATPDASISVDINNGSLDLPGGGNLTYSFYGPDGLIESGSITGAGPQTKTFTGLRGGGYVLDVTDEYSVCSATATWTVTDPVPDPFTISALDATICEDEDFILTIDNTDTQNGGIDVIYQAFEGATPLGAPVAGDGNPQNITISGLSPGNHTIYVTATEGTCPPVQSTNTVDVTVNPLPVAPAVTFNPTEYCVGETINAPFITSPNGTSTYTWYSDATLTTTLTTGTNPTIGDLNFSSAAANTTDVWVTETTAAGCEGPSVQLTLTVHALPLAPAVTFTPDTYCVGNTITPPTITTPVMGSTYTWYADLGLTTVLPTVNGVTPTNDELGFSSATVNTTTVYVTETTGTNCEGPATPVTLTVNETPDAPTVTFTPNSVCQGEPITPPVVDTPVGTSTYTWYSDAGLTTPIAVVTGTAPTNAELGFDSSTPNVTTVYVTETSDLGCEGPATEVTLTVRPTPIAPAVTFSPSTYCVDETITPPTITTPVAGSVYNWYSDAGLTTLLVVANDVAPTAAELGFSTAASNTLTVYVTETNSLNCEGPATPVTITVNPRPGAPSVTFTPAVYCAGEAITPPFVDAPVVGSTYKWYADAALTILLPTFDGITPTNAELGFDGSTANVTTVYVAETTALGCEGDPTTVTLTVNPTPDPPAITFTSDYCVGDAITPPSITTPVGGSTYTWYSDAGLTTVIASTPTPSTVALGFDSAVPNTTTVYVTERNASNCEGAATVVTLNVNARPVAPGVTFATTTYCQGEAITPPFVTAPVVGSSYTWYSDVTLTVPLVTANNPTNDDLGFSSATPNTTTVYVAERNAAGCEGPATSVTLTVNPTPAAPDVSFTPGTYCQGDPITPPSIVAPVGGSTYKWYSDAGLTTLLATTTTPSNADLGFSSVVPNTKDVFVTETNGSNCEGPATQITLVVNARPGAPAVTFNGSPFCEGDPFVAPVVDAPVATSTYNWYSDVGLTTTLATGATPTDVELGFSTAAANTTTVYVAETTQEGCQGPATTVTMVVNPRPVAPDVTFDPGPYCTGDALNAPFITSPVVGSTYRWYSDAGLTTLLVTTTNPTNGVLGFSTAAGDTVTVYVTELNGFNCESAPTAVTLIVNEIPELVPAQTTAICSGSPIGYEVQLANAPAGTELSWPDPDASDPESNAGSVVWAAGVATLTDVLTTTGAPRVVTYHITPTANGCTGTTQTVEVTVDVAATAFAGNPVTICVNTAYELADATVGGAATEGQWSIFSEPSAGAGSLSSVVAVPDPSVVTFTGTVAGDYTLRLVSDEPSGACVAAESFVTITVTDIPVVAAQSKTICGNDGVDLEILLDPANYPANTVFNWPDLDGPTGPQQAGVNIPIGTPGTIHIADILINDGAADIVVSYEVTPSVGLCVGATEVIDITVRPSPVVAPNQAKTICSGDFVAHEILLSPPNQPAGTTFSWPDPDYDGTGTSGLHVPADPAGTTHINDRLFNGTTSPILVTYQIIARGTNGCAGRVRDIDVTVNPGAVVEAGAAQSICSNGTVTLSGSSIGGLATTGTWSIINSPAGGDGVITDGDATATPEAATFQATVAGDYTLQLLTDDPAGSCPAVEDIVVITVKVPGDPSCTGTGIPPVCDPAAITATFTATDATCTNDDGTIVLSDIAGGTGPYTFELNGGIVNLPANNTLTGLTAGNYEFTITDATLCSRTFSPVIISFPGFVNHSAPVASGPDCSGSGANGSITIDIMDAGSFEFALTTDLTAEPASYNPVGGPQIFINNVANGTYAVWIRPLGAGLKCATKVSPIAVSGIVPVSFAATGEDVVCFGDATSITVSNINGASGLPYNYVLTNTATNSSSSGTISDVQALGAYTIPISVPGPYSLLLSQDQSSVNPLCTTPIMSAAANVTIDGPDALLEVSEVVTAISFPDRASGSALVSITTSGYDPYETRLELITPMFNGQSFVRDWSTVEFNPQNLKMESSYTNLYAGVYRLDLRDASGCVKTQTVEIGVDTQLQIPNVFTPNGDGVNEVFYIRNLPTSTQIVITNRWGNEVYRSSDYQNDWNGGNSADGIYYYRITTGGESFSGWVEILRGGASD